MISVQEALAIIANHVQDYGTEEVSFIEATGRILKEDIKADRDFPPFNRVAMDGIAIHYSAFDKGIRNYPIENIQAAGSKQLQLQDPAHCIEVMTGAVLPEGTDTVIPYEMIRIEDQIAHITIDEITAFQNIHHQGKDRHLGDVLIKSDTRIGPAEIGVIATVGKAKLQVAKPPKVLILSTGDELVEVEETPLTYQIRRSNSFSLQSLLGQIGIAAETVHIRDDKPSLKAKIARYLTSYDVLICSGAVSKGKYDFLPEVFDELGVQKAFHKVAQRPGKPFWFGYSASSHEVSPSSPKQKQDTLVFAFPGNPVSTYVNCLVYFYPWYAASVGLAVKEETVILGEDINFQPHLTYFLQVSIVVKYGHLVAYPIQGNGSGDLASLVQADGFIQLPKEQTKFKKGESFLLLRYRN